METPRSKINNTEIQRESLQEKVFRSIATVLTVIFPLLWLFCFKVVKQYERAVILRFGRVTADSPAGPGIICIIPLTDTVVLFDLRTQSFSLGQQEILTKDSVTITVDAVVYVHVTNPLNCLLNVELHRRATELLAVSLLRNILGQFTLTELLANRDSISISVRKEIDRGTAEWGVEVERVELKDVILPFELQKAMAAEAEGTRIAKAKIIEAEGEIKTAENLMEASKVIVEKPNTILRSERLLMNMQIKENNQGLQQVNIQRESDFDNDFNRDGDYSARESLQSTPRQTTFKEDNKLIEKVLVVLSSLLTIITFPLSMLYTFVIVQQYQKAIILRNGKVYKKRAFGPGLVFYLPCVDSIKFTDLRTICYDVPPQEALTKDSLTISVDAVVFYKIYDPIAAVINVTNYKVSTQYLAATTLRNALGTRKLSEVLVNRPAVSYQVFELMKHLTKDWGIQVVRVEIKDISLPLQLQKAMAAEAESTRLANAKIIVAKAEIESTKNLQKATEMLMDNPFCMQLRYLQSLQTIAGEDTHTIVFPFSVDALRSIFNR